ncbi:MAG: CDP-alcohol phosphatidyltransferase family protein [Candidatus Krumholzibacteriota bacterium]|nr:CDP-alcohol phosphatidyltransferase family protein [Candidatus Krumholzibacteriota bacterium]
MSVKTEIKNFFRRLLTPLVSLISLMGISPLTITSAGILISLVGAFLVAGGKLFAGGVALAISGLCDIIDGSLARKGEKVTVFGAFFDSTGDRVAELAYFGALVLYYAGKVPVSSFYIILVLIAMSGSLLTSYARARAEGLGVRCEIGFLERPERIILLIVGLIFGGVTLVTVIAVLAFLTVFTFIQRVVHVGKLTMGKDL